MAVPGGQEQFPNSVHLWIQAISFIEHLVFSSANKHTQQLRSCPVSFVLFLPSNILCSRLGWVSDYDVTHSSAKRECTSNQKSSLVLNVKNGKLEHLDYIDFNYMFLLAKILLKVMREQVSRHGQLSRSLTSTAIKRRLCYLINMNFVSALFSNSKDKQDEGTPWFTFTGNLIWLNLETRLARTGKWAWGIFAQLWTWRMPAFVNIWNPTRMMEHC